MKLEVGQGTSEALKAHDGSHAARSGHDVRANGLGRRSDPVVEVSTPVADDEATAELERAYEANVALAQSPPTHWSAADRSEQDGVVAALGWLVATAPPLYLDVLAVSLTLSITTAAWSLRRWRRPVFSVAPRPQRMASHATSLAASTTAWPGRWPPGTASRARPSELRLSH